MDSSVIEVLERHLRDPGTGFSVGLFGAIAEFHRRADEPVDIDELTAVTDRGALRIEPAADVRPLAYETLSGRPGRWNHGVVFCLPTPSAQCHARTVISELGPDSSAIRRQDRDALLFDMGLGAENVDFCIRTADADLIGLLRRESGGSVLVNDSPAMTAILEVNPHRVAIGGLGRVEVFQAIGRDVTPEGPHTHVLPRLLASGRTHSANIPVPHGYMPSLSMYPPSPIATPMGEPKPWDAMAASTFSELLSRWGDPAYVAEKERLSAAIENAVPPASYHPATSRRERTATRVTVRQMMYRAKPPERLDAWLALFDNAQNDRDIVA